MRLLGDHYDTDLFDGLQVTFWAGPDDSVSDHFTKTGTDDEGPALAAGEVSA